MASPQCHLLVWYLRRRVKRPIVEPVDIAGARLALGRGYRGRLPRGVRIVPAPADAPVRGEWVVRRDTRPDAPVLLYLHGGGFFACSPATHRAASAAFAASGRWRVFAPEYRLAPEHRFPAAIEDAVSCCDWIARTTGARVAALAGDSAGGTLVLSTLLRLRDTGRPLPAAAVAFSPVTDLAATGRSIVENDRRDALFFGASIAKLADIYLPPGVAPEDPLASPLYAALSGLPPLLLHVGREEVLRDDAVRFAERARRAGVAVALKLWPVVPHAWQLMGAFIPEGRRSLREAEHFLARQIAGSAPRAAAPRGA
jgi:acetyl esterase/lipase